MVNIKLSDYGISRQSYHEGVLGVEGTPGYQAPEVRPGIVYDEKVRASAFSSALSTLNMYSFLMRTAWFWAQTGLSLSTGSSTDKMRMIKDIGVVGTRTLTVPQGC